MRRRKRNTGGFTLAEVLVASVIVAFLLLALLTSFIMGRFATQVAKHRAQATNVLRARVEFLKGLGYDAVNLMSSVTVESGVPIDSVQGGVVALTGTRTTTITDVNADDVLELNVRLTWQELHLGRQIAATEEIETLLAPR
jgi:prepilin-type N-terminal cleavage/methylation domain-containing protein